MVEVCLEYGAIIRQPKVSNNRFYSCVLVALARVETRLEVACERSRRISECRLRLQARLEATLF